MATVNLTLEQLDQFGSLDSLTLSLDSSDWNSTTQKNVTGPWVLEGLDAFSSSIDSLAISLDSELWATAYLWDGVADITANATVVANAEKDIWWHSFCNLYGYSNC